MPDDFDAVVADQFKLLDQISVPDTWSKVRFNVLDDGPVEVTDLIEQDMTVAELKTGSETGNRPRRVVVGLLAAACVLLVVALGFVLRREQQGTVVNTNTPTTADRASAKVNGWVALAAGYGAESPSADADIYLVREGSPAHRIAGSEDDVIDQVCPAFSPDSARLAYGQAEGTAEVGYQNPALIIAELTADGIPAASTTIDVDGMSRPPCVIWSADGRWLAFGAGTVSPHVHPGWASEVWVVDTATGNIRRIPAVAVTDIEWAPDASELYIVTDDRIVLYSVATDETREFLDDSWGVSYVAVSPDGQSIAIQGVRTSEEELIPRSTTYSFDLRMMDIDGSGESTHLTDRGIIAQDLDQMHTMGPVWSPDGRRIAYPRVCGYTPDNHQCVEQHEVVVVTVDDHGPLDTAAIPPMLDMAQVVVSPPETTSTSGDKQYWYPYNVIWSPDSTALLYGAWGGTTTSGSTTSLLAVNADGDTPPVVLYDALDLSVYDGYPRVSFQSWSQQRD